MPATAADIPEELFDVILSFVAVYAIIAPRNHVPVGKRGLGQFALVCRRWGRICQTKIFAYTFLRSRQDFYDLCAFMARPGSVIPSAIRFLELQIQDESVPWIHLVCLRIPPRMRNPGFHIVLSIGKWEGNHQLLGRTVHGMVPWRLPTFSLSIGQLNLTRVRFRSLEDLARVVGEMPSLFSLTCDAVTWVAPGRTDDQLYLPSSVLLRSKGVNYAMVDCTDDCAVITLSVQVAPMRHRVHHEDAGIMRAVSRIFVPKDTAERLTAHSSIQYAGNTGAVVWFQFINNDDAPELSFKLAPYPYPLTSLYEVEVLAIYFTSTNHSVTDLQKYDWRSFDMLAASFCMQWRVVVGFMSRDLLMSFATEVAATDLQFLSSTDKLHYAVWNGKTHIKDFRWIAVTPGASEQQEQEEPSSKTRYDLHLL